MKAIGTDGVLVVIDDIAARLAQDDPQWARAKTLGVFAVMAGTLQLSRAMTDRQLADDVLEPSGCGVDNADPSIPRADALANEDQASPTHDRLDVVVLLDLPDNQAAGAIAPSVDAAGGAATKTIVLLTPEEVDGAAKRSRDAVDYRPPGT